MSVICTLLTVSGNHPTILFVHVGYRHKSIFSPNMPLYTVSKKVAIEEWHRSPRKNVIFRIQMAKTWHKHADSAWNHNCQCQCNRRVSPQHYVNRVCPNLALSFSIVSLRFSVASICEKPFREIFLSVWWLRSSECYFSFFTITDISFSLIKHDLAPPVDPYSC